MVKRSEKRSQRARTIPAYAQPTVTGNMPLDVFLDSTSTARLHKLADRAKHRPDAKRTNQCAPLCASGINARDGCLTRHSPSPARLSSRCAPHRFRRRAHLLQSNSPCAPSGTFHYLRPGCIRGRQRCDIRQPSRCQPVQMWRYFVAGTQRGGEKNNPWSVTPGWHGKTEARAFLSPPRREIDAWHLSDRSVRRRQKGEDNTALYFSQALS